MQAPSAADIDLLARILRGDHEGAARYLGSRQESIETFLELVAAGGLSIVFLRALQDSPLRRDFPACGLAALEDRRRRQIARSDEFLAELERLADRFAAAGQPFMLLKGPYLAARFYGDLHGREFVDLDLLVPSPDRARAFSLLAAAGYARKSRVLLGERLTCHFVHGFDFVKDGIQVDLHWCLSRHPSFRVDEAAIWGARQSYAVGAHRYDVLSDEHEVVLAVLSLLRDLERGRLKIKNLVDLLRVLAVLDAQLDWNAFLEARRGDATLGPTVNLLALCLDVGEARALVPRLESALTRHVSRRVPVPAAATPSVFAPAFAGLGNKWWCARVYDASLAQWLLWWAASLPFRFAVHHRRRRAPAEKALPERAAAC